MGRTKTLSPPFACRNPHCTTATPDLHYCEVTSSNHPCKFKSRASGLDAVTTRHAPHATQPSILCFSEYSKVNLGLKNLMLSMRLAVLCCLCPSCFWRKQSFIYMFERTWISALHRCCAQVVIKGIRKTLDILLPFRQILPTCFTSEIKSVRTCFWKRVSQKLQVTIGNKSSARDHIVIDSGHVNDPQTLKALT